MDAVVTGLGMVTPYGVGRDLAWRMALDGVDGLRPIARFDASPYRNRLGGEVPDSPAVDCLLEAGHSRPAAYACLAAQEALDQAQFPDTARPGLAIALGTNFGPMREGEAAFRGRMSAPDKAASLAGHLPSSMLSALRECLAPPAELAPQPQKAPASPPEAVVSLSCASGAAALAVGLGWLRAGRSEAVLAGGVDELSETCVAGLSALRAISRDTVRPYDAGRDGTIFGEGAGMLLLENAASAAWRGARPLARLAGAAVNNDAFHMTAPDQEAEGIIQVMRQALADAGLPPEAVDHVNLHGTGTPYNDKLEAKAVQAVFGAHVQEMRFTASKSLFGHLMGAAGAVEAALAVLSLAGGRIPPTIRSVTPDPDLRLPLVRNAAQEFPMRVALSNSYGLGGTNACVVFAAP